MTIFDQIRWQPCQEEIDSVVPANPRYHHVPHVRRGQKRPPGDLRLFRTSHAGMDSPVAVHASDMCQLGFVCPLIFLGRVAVNGVEQNRPANTESSEDVKHRSPAPDLHDEYCDGWNDRTAEAAEGVSNPLNEASLLLWIPELHGPGGRRVGPAFAETKQEPDGDKRGGAECLRGQHRKQ